MVSLFAAIVIGCVNWFGFRFILISQALHVRVGFRDGNENRLGIQGDYRVFVLRGLQAGEN